MCHHSRSKVVTMTCVLNGWYTLNKMKKFLRRYHLSVIISRQTNKQSQSQLSIFISLAQLGSLWTSAPSPQKMFTGYAAEWFPADTTSRHETVTNKHKLCYCSLTQSVLFLFYMKAKKGLNVRPYSFCYVLRRWFFLFVLFLIIN